MTYLDGTKAQFQSFMALPDDGTFYMLNLLKFKDQVPETGKTGREQYREYLQAATPFLQESGAEVVFTGTALLALIGPQGDVEWDKVLIVKYANKAAFSNMVTRPDYPGDLRKMALADSRLICCKV